MDFLLVSCFAGFFEIANFIALSEKINVGVDQTALNPDDTCRYNLANRKASAYHRAPRLWSGRTGNCDGVRRGNQFDWN